MSRKIALVTGATGMDGSYLLELLLSKGYEVHGMVRRSSSFNRGRIDHLTKDPNIHLKSLFLHYGDMTDGTNVSSIVNRVRPDIIINTAAQSHVGISFSVPEYSGNTDGLGVIRLLEAMRSFCPDAKFLQCSTSELFGKVAETPQNENTPFRPQSPYAAAKLYAYWVTRNYRDAYNIFASNAITFNHEGPRRGYNFVTRKITLSVARIKAGIQDCLSLGNMAAKRDWGDAEDYMRCFDKILQHNEPDDFVIATGETHTVEEFCDRAFEVAGMPLEWLGEDLERIGVDKDGIIRVKVDPAYFRPLDVHLLLGDASKAKRVLGWEPKIKFDHLVERMVKNDMDMISRGEEKWLE